MFGIKKKNYVIFLKIEVSGKFTLNREFCKIDVELHIWKSYVLKRKNK